MFLLNDCGSTACSVPICHCFTCHCWNSLMFWLTSWNSVFGGQDLQLGKMLMVSRDGILSGNSSLDGWLLGNIVEVWRHVPLKKAPHLVGIWTVSIQVTAPPPPQLLCLAVCSGDEEADSCVGLVLVSVLPGSRFMTMDKSFNFFRANFLICEMKRLSSSPFWWQDCVILKCWTF